MGVSHGYGGSLRLHVFSFLPSAKTTKFPSVGINGRLLQSADGSEQACNFYGG